MVRVGAWSWFMSTDWWGLPRGSGFEVVLAIVVVVSEEIWAKGAKVER